SLSVVVAEGVGMWETRSVFHIPMGHARGRRAKQVAAGRTGPGYGRCIGCSNGFSWARLFRHQRDDPHAHPEDLHDRSASRIAQSSTGQLPKSEVLDSSRSEVTRPPRKSLIRFSLTVTECRLS